ncbi:hypothetical protein [Pseudomonas fluorescens]|uniref:Uncharacterized protein n=1 Tax=Pseudomonas fluorescens TaxID=294 RepID=A0A423LMV0_PSEFL|nr:hypothetical protein [Pseudomonas fluorescens]RON69681.1 hypothetical protein BK671_09715 [Pseudomonas fluorescens]
MALNLDWSLEVNDEQFFIGFVQALGANLSAERVLEETTSSSRNLECLAALRATLMVGKFDD